MISLFLDSITGAGANSGLAILGQFFGDGLAIVNSRMFGCDYEGNSRVASIVKNVCSHAHS